MRTSRALSVLFIASALYVFHASPALSLTESSAGNSIPVKDFALLDQEGVFHRLYYYSDMKAVVLISQGNSCPILRQEIPYLRRLKRSYERRNVVFLMINANPQDDREAILQEAREYRIPIPILEDRSQTVAESLNLTRTAEAILIDPSDWRILYRGAITDRLDYGTQRQKAKHQYLRDAIDSLLEKRPVALSKTTVKGCLIHMKNKDRHTPYTYTADVAPVLEKHCVLCHVTGGIAPWSMDSYGKIKGWGPMIREVVQTKRMPPWHADPHYGGFKDDISLNPEEVRTIIHWIDQGYPRGKRKDPLAKPRPAKNRWVLGEPDLIFSLKEEQSIPASGGEQFRNIESDVTVKEDIWVKAIDMQPGNFKILHHGLVFAIPEDPEGGQQPREWALDALMMAKNLIGGYSPGGGTWIWPKDTGIFIPKGSKLVFGLHYIPTGKPEHDRTQVGLYLCGKRPSNVGFIKDILKRPFRIPAGEKNYKLRSSYIFNEAVTLVTIKPHMHYRGKNMRCTAKYPDGTSEVLLSVPDYKFLWQRLYMLKKPKDLPAGTEIVVEGYFDNSAQNPGNPDPSADVVNGPHSRSEMFMCRLWLSVKKR